MAIQANELRVGNQVLKGGIVVTIDGRSIMDIQFSEGYAQYYQPIQITEEWLIKLGFGAEKLGSIFCSPDKMKAKSYKDIGFTSPDFFYNNRLKRWMDCQTRVCVDYVHQVQNLFFALTGEELTVLTTEQAGKP